MLCRPTDYSNLLGHVSSMSSDLVVSYTEDYKERCFQAWYLSGRPARLDSKIFPRDEYGRVPKARTLREWKADNGWIERGDELDAKAHNDSDNALVIIKAEMLKRQAELGKLMQDKGSEYLKGDKGIDDAHAAILAIVKGAELERTSRGLDEFMRKLSKMTNEEVKNEILKLTARVEIENIVDAEEVTEDIENKA